MDPNHPKEQLACIVLSPSDGALEQRVREVASRVGGARSWVTEPPAFAKFGDTRAGHASHCGIVLHVYSALPPWGRRLPLEVDHAQYEEVQLVVEALARFSGELGGEVALYLAETHVGAIEAGTPDERITDGLLGEWRERLEARRSTEGRR